MPLRLEFIFGYYVFIPQLFTQIIAFGVYFYRFLTRRVEGIIKFLALIFVFAPQLSTQIGIEELFILFTVFDKFICKFLLE